MRSIIWLILVMIGLTVTGRSDDTLFVRSFRTIDMCSSQRSALFVLEMGQINASDSLMLFDITFGYDTNSLRPGVLLKENTLGNQLNYYNGPFMNLTVPSEIRLSGFSINRVAVGRLPLIAFNADVLADFCHPTSLLTLPYTPEFNEEFKRPPNLIVIDSVISVKNQRSDTTKGIQFDVDSIANDSSNVLKVPFTIDQGLAVGSNVRFSLMNRQGYNIVNIEVDQADAEVGSIDESTANIEIRENVRSITGNLVLMRTLDTASATISAVVTVDSCQCIRPEKRGRIGISYIKEPTTSVDADEDAELFRITSGRIILQHLHEHPIASIIDILGKHWWSSNTPVLELNLNELDLPSGVYYVILQTSTRTQARNFVKK